MKLEVPIKNISEEEVRTLLATKLWQEGLVSLGKAAEIAGFSERTFAELLLRRGVSPIRYTNINLKEELRNA